MDNLLAQVDAGRQLSAADQRALVNALMRELHWRDRSEAAREIAEHTGENISTATLMDWRRHQGAPVPRKIEDIPKVPMLWWLATQRRKPGRPSSGGGDLKEKKLKTEIQILEARLQSMLGKTVELDAVRHAVGRAMEELKLALLHELPARAIEAAQTLPVDEAIDEISKFIAEGLNRLSAISERLAEDKGTEEANAIHD